MVSLILYIYLEEVLVCLIYPHLMTALSGSKFNYNVAQPKKQKWHGNYKVAQKLLSGTK